MAKCGIVAHRTRRYAACATSDHTRCPSSARQRGDQSKEKTSMRKQELVRAVAEATESSEAQATKAVNAVFDAIESALAKGDEVTLSGFGSFKVVERSARSGRNPQTGEEIKIAARKSPVFRPGTQLKRAVE
ncbi:MAG: HU family DNA-binding protein [Thermomicrobiales bacterium]